MGKASEYYIDKVAVVTGGASGVGLAMAETMLSYGASKVILADFNDDNLRSETARLKEDVAKMIQEAAESGGGRIDMLFNNAGAGFAGYFDKLTNDDWAKAFALNFYGALYGIRAVLPIMRAQGDGHIIDIISGIAFAPLAQQTMYAATKAALNGLTLALRYEYWDDNIRFTSATPGTTITAIWKAGGTEPPKGAQTAEQSARTILAGVAKNERLVLGDEGDVSGAKYCFHPDVAAANDEYLLNVARRRARESGACSRTGVPSPSRRHKHNENAGSLP